MNKDENLWSIATKAALRVEFITSGRELFLYTNAIYMAMEWGWGKSVEEKNDDKTKIDKLLKGG